MSDSSIVEFHHVSYRIDGTTVLEDLNLEVGLGETLVLLGRSGSGKTTALKMVNALLFPTSGEVLVDGKSTREWDLIQLRRSIGYVIQETGLFPHLTISANVGLVPGLEHWPPERIAERTATLLDRVGLDPAQFGNRHPRQLSGGQRQRVGVARALAADQKLLLLDEPFGALDPVMRLEMQEQFLELRRVFGKTSIFVTHDVREAVRLGSRIGLLNRGRLEILASPEKFLESQRPEAREFLACLKL